MPARIDDNPGAFLCHDPLGSAVTGNGRVGHLSLSLCERVLRVSMQLRRWRSNPGKYLNSNQGLLPIDCPEGRGNLFVSLKTGCRGLPPPREGASDDPLCPKQKTFRWQD